jgi:DNA repair protein SbcC/Rad50
MITYLKLVNFRRHADTELIFDDSAQLVLFSGPNGNGKTTVAIEAVMFALYGQSRHGRRGLDRLVRRGAELEGMQVELKFMHGGVEYHVNRRREGRHPSATLYANENPIAVSVDAVTAEITRILGMDAAAFRIAAVAQQKEIEGLTKVRASDRPAMLSRLLRVDAVTRAKNAARSEMNLRRKALEALPSTVALEQYEAAVNTAQIEHQSCLAAAQDSREALAQFDAELAASAAVDAEWAAATTGLARATGAAQAAEAEVTRLSDALAAAQVPETLAAPEQTLMELAAMATAVERELANAESAARTAAHGAMVASELAKVQVRLDELDVALAGVNLDQLSSAVSGFQAAAEGAQAAAQSAQAAAAMARDEKVALQTQSNEITRRAKATESLDESCPTCEQTVPETHRQKLRSKRASTLSALSGALSAAIEAEIAALSEASEAAEAAAEALASSRQAQAALEQGRRDNAEYLELCRRRDTLAEQLPQTQVQEVDLDELYARKGEIAALIASSQAADEALRAREAVLTRRAEMVDSLNGARARAELARTALQDAAIPVDLQERFAERAQTIAAREAEAELLAACMTQEAVAASALNAARSTLERVRTDQAGRLKLQQDAAVAANAEAILADAESALNSSMIPALEGGIASMLSLLSEGRFTQVSLDKEYNISVGDDGGLQPLEEFSGGELDLIALSVRLALTGIIAERQGLPLGWLILDECFGSLDAERRRTVIAGLRQLRPVLGQIWVISHVPGLEDECDRIIEVTDSLDEFGRRIAKAA